MDPVDTSKTRGLIAEVRGELVGALREAIEAVRAELAANLRAHAELHKGLDELQAANRLLRVELAATKARVTKLEKRLAPSGEAAAKVHATVDLVEG